MKSIGNGMTFPRDLVGREECHAGLMPLCESVGARLRAQGLKCRTITLQIKDPSLKVISRQRTLAVPTALTRQIYRECCGILAASWPEKAPVRLMTVTLSGLCAEDAEAPAQLSFLEDVRGDDPRQERIERAIDDVRRRFGRGSVETAMEKGNS